MGQLDVIKFCARTTIAYYKARTKSRIISACRVIARLKQERDEARSLLAQAERHMPMPLAAPNSVNKAALSSGKRAAEDAEMGPNGKRILPGISYCIISELTDCNAALSQQRKRRQDIIATAGVDSNAVVFDRPSGQIVSTLSGHSKKVTSVGFVTEGEFLVMGSADKTVRVWQGSENGSCDCRHILKDHTAEVISLIWCFYDLSAGLCLAQVEGTSGSSEGYTSTAFHPDGLILGTGTIGALVKFWDVKSQVHVRFDGHIGTITAVSLKTVSSWRLQLKMGFGIFEN